VELCSGSVHFGATADSKPWRVLDRHFTHF
jgi:hypothetical protein